MIPTTRWGVSGDARDADMRGALEVSVVVTDPDRAASDRSTGRQIEAGIEAGQVRTGRSTMSRPTLSRRPDLRGTDYQLAGPGPSVLDRVLHEIQAGRPALSPPRHNVQVRIERADGAVTVAVPGAHANVLICAGEPMTAGIPVRLVAQ